MATNTPTRNELIRWRWFDQLSQRFDNWLDDIGERFSNLAVLYILLISAICVTLISGDAQLTLSGSWWEGFWQNFATELFGAFFTFFLIEGIVGAREKRSDRELQESVAFEIREQLRTYIQAQQVAQLHAATSKEQRQPILESMKATDLLAGANLRGTQLEYSFLLGADFREAYLGDVNLSNAILVDARFEQAKLWSTDLTNAKLRSANLEDADLLKANLTDARLEEANLKNAAHVTAQQLRQAETLQGTVLPDGTELPNDDTWREAFEAWVSSLET